MERELYISELLAAMANRVGELSERLDALDGRVAALEAKPRRKAPVPKASEANE